MLEKPYQICTRCVMDTSDPDIRFDTDGVCSHCHGYDTMVRKYIISGEAGQRHLEALAEKIRKDGKDKDYDCIIGISGGVDSSYVACKVKELGLRPLAVHLDNGWDSELAVKNIENLLRLLNIDLYTHVIDWEEFKDLQISFLKASTPDSEIPSDHAIVAIMFQMADKMGVKYVISGCNVRTETHLPTAWSQGHSDWRYIKAVHDRFGSLKLKTYPHTAIIDRHRYILTKYWIDLLNFIDYNKEQAKQYLKDQFCWKDYGGKHYESLYTRFYQGYILPKKFGYDKRKVHFSSLICSGEMIRAEALEELKKDTYSPDLQKADMDYLLKKFQLSEEEFDNIMNLPRESYWDYPSYGRFYNSRTYQAIIGLGRPIYNLYKLFIK